MAKFKMAMVASLVAVAAIGCGVAPEEGTIAYDSGSYNTPAPTAPVAPTVTNTDADDADLEKDGCEAFGLVYDAANNTCVDDEHETNIVAPPVNEEDDILNPFNFTVTPGKRKLVATWTGLENVSSFRIERTQEGSPHTNVNYPTDNSWTLATFSCTAHSFKLIATMMDGSTIESDASDYMKPTNCE